MLSHICSTKQRHSASDIASSLFAGYSFRVMLPTRRLIVITCYINSSLERASQLTTDEDMVNLALGVTI